MSLSVLHGGDDIQVVVFRLAGQEFAFDIQQVERILRHAVPSALPSAPDFLEGVLPYGGAVVPVVDLRKRVSVPAALRDETRTVIVTLEGQRIGVIVDEVREVLRIDSRTITSPPPIVRGLAAAYIAGIISRGERTIVLLNAARLLNATERLALATLEPAAAGAA
jgi:purine-binding chemotaxis protein CheW